MSMATQTTITGSPTSTFTTNNNNNNYFSSKSDLCCRSSTTKQNCSLASRKPTTIITGKSNYGIVSDEQWQKPLAKEHIYTTGKRWCTGSRAFISTTQACTFGCVRPCTTMYGYVLNNTTRKFNQIIVRQSLVEQSQTETEVNMKRLADFLYEDLPHLFDDKGIDRTAYDERVKFRDPITKHDTVSGYLFNITMLKKLFRPDFQLHWVKQTGPYELTTRWTMVMTFMLLPWKPELIFTGTSVMGVNPETNKFCSHVDYWDSIKNNDYFSFEGLLDVFKQLRIYKTPDLETPNFQILRRTATYEVRKYDPFIVVETNGDQLSGSRGFNDVAGYIFGKNSTAEKIPMTTPVFTQSSFDTDESQVSIQIVLPLQKDMSSLPAPNQEAITLKKVEGGTAAVLKFSGKPTEEIVKEKEKELRLDLIRDGLKPKTGCSFARYNDPRTWNFVMRNEVLIWLEDFTME